MNEQTNGDRKASSD